MTEIAASPGASPVVGEPAAAGNDRLALVVEALKGLVESPLVAFVPSGGASAGLSARHWADADVSASAIRRLDARVVAWLASPDGSDSRRIEQLEELGWQVLLAEVRTEADGRCGAVAVARQAATTWTEPELAAVNTLTRVASLVCEDHEGDSRDALQRSLDDLVTLIAVELMPVSSLTLPAALDWTLRTLVEFFGVDTSFLRRNEPERNLTVLVTEWPRRPEVPDPDPLGEVPFDADPVWSAIRDLKEPFVIRPESSPDEYQERVQEGSGIQQVSLAMVPLLHEHATVGTLGFIKFGDRPWSKAETNALQAVASLIVQLQSRVEAEDRLHYHAYHDDLTGLPNRRALLNEVDRRLSSDPSQSMALLFFDLDRFKIMNDFLGHSAGDRLLVAVADRLRDYARSGDYVARLAGDEFVLLLDRPAADREVLAVAEQLVEIVGQPIDVGGHQITRTASLGIASTRQEEGVTAEELLAHADAALYRAKNQGGNKVVVFDDALQAAVEEHSNTEILLRDAIDHGGLELYFQPEIDLRTGALLAVEALVRWHHPTRGLLPAGVFITTAEETGLIVDLGRWVLGEACRQMADWRRRYPERTFSMRVNMSPAQLASRNIVGLVAESLVAHELPGDVLCLEITEQAVMQDVNQALAALHDLRSLGITLAIDDFGTGFSSMTQLKRLPVDTLKVDQSFIAGLGIDPGDRAIVESCVRLADSFGLDVVAEGVETVELVNELIGLGCWRAQGFLLSKPKPAAELEEILARGGIDMGGYVHSPRTSALV